MPDIMAGVLNMLCRQRPVELPVLSPVGAAIAGTWLKFDGMKAGRYILISVHGRFS